MSKINKWILGLILIQSIVFFQWIFTDALFTFGDVGIYTSHTQLFLLEQIQSIYKAYSDFGSLDITASNSPFLFIFGILAKLGINFIRSVKIALFAPIVFGVAINSFLLVKYFTKDNIASFISALFYSYGFYFLITLTGSLYISYAYAFAPLLLLCFFKNLKEPSIKNSIIFSLITTWIGFVEFRIVYILLFICFLYFIYFILYNKFSGRKILYYIYFLSFSGLIFLLLNSFWILPIVFQGAITNNVLFNRGLFGDIYFDMTNALVFMHPWWNWGLPTIFVKQTASFFLFIIPLVIILGLIKNNKKSIYIFFTIIFLLGVFLTKQSAEPFGSVYLWLYNNFPGFNAFREASKFFILPALSFLIILGIFLVPKNSKYTILQKIFAGSFLSIVIVNMYIVMSGGLGTMFIPRPYEKDVMKLNDFYINDKEFYRILWLPHTNKFSEHNGKHPVISFLGQHDNTYKNLIKKNNNTLEETFQDIISQDNFVRILREQSIKYIIIPRNLIWDDIDSPWKEPKLYIPILDSLKGVKKVFSDRNNFVYEVKNIFPRIYSSNIVVDQKTNTHFSIYLKDLYHNTPLIFNDAYNSGWKLYIEPYENDSCYNYFSYSGIIDKRKNNGINTYNVKECITKINFYSKGNVSKIREISLFDSTHRLFNGYYNSWSIDPKYIKNNFSKEYYEENLDGSINVHLTLYFKPQSYFYIGVFISISLAIVIFFYLIFLFIITKIYRNY